MPRDAILIPGGGVRSGGVLPPWTQARLRRAIELYDGEFLITLSAGTPHRAPPLDDRGFPIFESVAAAKFLIDAGIPPERILTETHSYDTIGNAYFSRVIHAGPRNLRRLLVITSAFHLARTQAIFEWMYRLAPATPPYTLEFDSVPDAEPIPAARLEREKESLASFKKIAASITTLAECHRWLFTEHSAYNASREAFRSSALDRDVQNSY